MEDVFTSLRFFPTNAHTAIRAQSDSDCWGLGLTLPLLDARRITKQIEEAIRTGRLEALRRRYSNRPMFRFLGWFLYVDDFPAAFEESVESHNGLSRIIARWLFRAETYGQQNLTITINGILKVFGDILRAIQEAQNRRAQAVFAKQRSQTFIFKARHKPLQVIPESIHPIDLSA